MSVRHSAAMVLFDLAGVERGMEKLMNECGAGSPFHGAMEAVVPQLRAVTGQFHAASGLMLGPDADGTAAERPPGPISSAGEWEESEVFDAVVEFADFDGDGIGRDV